MLAYAEGRQQVQARHVRKAAADTPESHKDWMVWVWWRRCSGDCCVLVLSRVLAAMSIINQVLNELEKRGANVPLGEATIRAVAPRRQSRLSALRASGC